MSQLLPQDISFIFPDLNQQVLNEVFERTIAQLQNQLKAFANLPESESLEKFGLAFGSNFDQEKAIAIINNWKIEDWQDLPSVEFVSSNQFNGAFSRDTGKIYLSKEFITRVVSEFNAVEEISIENEWLQELVAVSIEEIGHSVEAKLNQEEIAGDEGAIFSALVRGEDLSNTELQQLRNEDDTSTVLIDDELIEIEQNYASITPHTTVTATGDNNIDALLGTKWQSPTVTYSFTDNFTNDYEEESGYPESNKHSSSFKTFNNVQRKSFLWWVNQFNGISNLNLIELEGDNDRDATIRVAQSNLKSTAGAYPPFETFEAGDIWFNPIKFNSPNMGNYAWHNFGHELGHALGLKHGHETFGLGSMDSERDSIEFSIMTYRSFEGQTTPVPLAYVNDTWSYAQSLMMYDIAAIQHLYGADFDLNSNDTTYSFSVDTGEMSINGVKDSFKPGQNIIFRTVWDGNGNDTYDFSNYTTSLSVDLRPGKWSNLDSLGNFQKAKLDQDSSDIFARGHIFNALQYQDDPRSLIENAIGGSGDDDLYGNQVDNNLTGNVGSDFLYGYEGNDTLKGGAGDNDYLYGGMGNDFLDGGDGIGDIANFSDVYDNYTISQSEENSSHLLVTHDDTQEQDIVVNIETLAFSDQSIPTSSIYNPEDLSILESFFQSLKELFGGSSASPNSLSLNSLSLSSTTNTNNSIFDTKIPLLGDALGNIQNAGSIINEVQAGIANLFQPDILLTADEIAEQLSTIPDITVSKLSEGADSVEFALDLTGNVNLGNISLAPDLGLLDQFGLNINGNAAVDLTYNMQGLRFGVNQSEAYINRDSSDLDITVNVDLPDTGISGKLGCIPLEIPPLLTDNLNFDFTVDLDSFNHSLDFSQLGDINLFNFDFELPDGAIDLPGISGGLKLNLSELGNLDFSDPNFDYEIPFSFDDIKLDLGSLYTEFLKPALGKIDQVFKPLEPFFGIINTEIPIISKLSDASFLDFNSDGKVTFRDLAEFEAQRRGLDVNFGLIDNIVDFSKFVTSVPTTGDIITLGDINIDGLGNINQAPINVTTPSLNLPSGFNFPLLDNPFEFATNLILGTPTEIFTYRTPELDFSINPGQFIPIIGPLGVRIGGNFGAKVQFGFGFDTYGLTCGDEHHAFEDGFYVTDTANLDGTGEDIPEAILTAGVSLDGGVDLGIAKAFIGGDVNGTININLNDPSPEDGKIRLSEIPFNNPSNIFDPITLDAIYAQLDAWFQIGIPGLNYREDYDLSPQIPLINADQLNAASNWIKDQADRLNGHIEDFNQGLGQVVDVVLDTLADGEKAIRDAGRNLEKTAVKARDDVNQELARFDRNILQPLAQGITFNNPYLQSVGKRLSEYRENFYDTLDVIGSIIDGSRETVRVDVPTRKTFSYKVEGNELKIFLNSNSSSKYGVDNNLVVQIKDGEIIFGGSEINYEEVVGIKYKGYARWIWQGFSSRLETGWEKTGEDRQIVTHYNADSVNASGINKIRIWGTNSNDTIIVNDSVNKNVWIAGREGDDLLQGGSGNDEIYGEKGHDTILGGRGNDDLDGYMGDDVISGGDGNDILDGYTGNDRLEGGADHDKLWGGDGNDDIFGDDTKKEVSGDDYLYGGAGDDLLDGGAGNDYIEGQDDVDFLDGGAGDDRLYGGGLGNNVLKGGSGNDRLVSGDGGDNQRVFRNNAALPKHGLLLGEEGNDTISGGGYLDGGAGDDHLNGYDGNDTLVAGEGAGSIKGGYGQDFLIAGYNSQTGQASVVDAGADPDQIVATDGHDNIDGGSGDEGIYGLKGNDTLDGSSGNDTLFGQEGNDELDGGIGDDILDGESGTDVLEGGYGKDQLDGGIGNDVLDGGKGNDQLDGGAGNDQIDGGDGNDTLINDSGADVLQGGYGNDSYIISPTNGGGTVIGSTYVGDYGGTDNIVLDGITLSFSHLRKDGVDLMVDLNQDGSFNAAQDLTIKRFFPYWSPALQQYINPGLIETVDNLSGSSIRQHFNVAPTLLRTNFSDLSPVAINAIAVAGDTVEDLFGSLETTVSDSDGRQAAIAVTSVDNSQGTWQYSLDDGVTWTAFGTPSQSNARLLDKDDKIRFLPDRSQTNPFNASFTFRAWDKVTGSPGGTANTTQNGGNTAFSSESATATVDVLLPAPDVAWIRQLESQPNPNDPHDHALAHSIVESVTIDNNGNIYLAGYTTGVVGGGTPQGGQNDTWEALYNSEGTPLWRRQGGTSLDDLVSGSAADQWGNYYTVYNSTNYSDYFGKLTKRNNTGYLVGETTIGNKVADVSTDNYDGVYVVGREDSGWKLYKYHILGVKQWSVPLSDIDYHQYRFRVTADHADYQGHVYVASYDGFNKVSRIDKYNANHGTYITSWELANAEIREIDVDDDGNIYVAGSTSTKIGETHAGGIDAWVAKYTPQGSRLWLNQYGTSRNDAITGLNIGSDGSVYSGGQTTARINNITESWAWTIKYDTDGNLQWAKQLKNIDKNQFNGEISIDTKDVAVTPDGDIYIVGTINGEYTAVNESGTQQTSRDTWISRLVPVNRPPILDDTYNPLLTSVVLNNNNSGNPISDIVGNGSIEDYDSQTFEAIAIDYVDNSNGSWQYSLNNGSSWNNLGTPSETAARLLAPDNKIRFVPNSNYVGDASFTFHAWDISIGSTGSTLNLTTASAQNATSITSDTAEITVFDAAKNQSFSTDEDNPSIVSLLPNSFDSSRVKVSQINTTSIGSSNTINLPSGAIVNIDQQGFLTYNPNGQFEGLQEGETATDSFNYTLEYDNNNQITDTATITFTIEGVNDAPIVSPPYIVLPDAREGETYNYVIPDNHSFIDPDGDELTYTVQLQDNSPFPNWLTFDSTTRTFSGTPTKTDTQGETVYLDLEIIARDPQQEEASFNVQLTVFPIPRAELDVRSLNIQEATVTPGQTITINYEILNNSHTNANPFQIAFYVSEDIFISETDQYIGSDVFDNGLYWDYSHQEKSISLTLPQIDTPFWNEEDKFYLGAIIDPDNTVDEIDESNNVNRGLGIDIDEIIITLPNNPPVAQDDFYTTDEGTIITGNILENDEDIDGENFIITYINESIIPEGNSITLDSGALLTLNGDGSFEYNPNNQFNDLQTGEFFIDGFTYTISDGEDSSTATVSISIGDAIAPELIDLSFNPTVIDTSNADGEIEVTIEFSDDFSGLDYAYLVFESSSGEKSISSVILSDYQLISGDSLNGVISRNLTLPQYSEPGTWQLKNLDLIDFNDNEVSFNTEQLEALNFPTEFSVSGKEDVTAPELIDFKVNPTVINTSSGDGEIEVTIEFSDDLSGLDYAYLVFESPSGEESISSVILSDYRLISGDSLNGVISRNITLPQDSEIGTWQLKNLDLIDFTDNEVSFTAQQLQNLGFTTELAINTNADAVFDIDGDGQYLAAVDGLLFYGYLNIRNLPAFLRDNLTQQLADNLINPESNATRITGEAIASYLESDLQMMDIDGDGKISAAIDGLLAYGYLNIRSLPPFLRDNLTQQLANNLIPPDSNAIRQTGADISAFIESYIV